MESITRELELLRTVKDHFADFKKLNKEVADLLEGRDVLILGHSHKYRGRRARIRWASISHGFNEITIVIEIYKLKGEGFITWNARESREWLPLRDFELIY